MKQPTRGVDALRNLLDEYETCEACPALCAARTAPVFGDGTASGPILVVGGAPGEEEDATGIPFWGSSGRLMMELFRLAWPDRAAIEVLDELWDHGPSSLNTEYWEELRDYLNQFVFWTNIVLCRAEADDSDRRKRIRPPSKGEIKACRDRLLRTIYAVDPLLIIATGKQAASALVGKSVHITKTNGRYYDLPFPSPVTGDPVRYTVLTLIGPAYLKQRGESPRLMEEGRGATYDTFIRLQEALEIVDLAGAMQGQGPLLEEDTA